MLFYVMLFQLDEPILSTRHMKSLTVKRPGSKHDSTSYTLKVRSVYIYDIEVLTKDCWNVCMCCTSFSYMFPIIYINSICDKILLQGSHYEVHVT